jgi:prepilin-type N-terminal cleavage/methylation domain-containing protein
MQKQRNAFTLVELVVIIAILGILAAYAVPKYQELYLQALLSEAKAQLATVRSALNIYYAQHEGHYPDTIDGSLFADGTVPAVTVTAGDYYHRYITITSNAVVVVVHDDGKVIPPDVTNAGGWIYAISPDRTKCDARINSHRPDYVTKDLCPPFGRPWYGY